MTLPAATLPVTTLELLHRYTPLNELEAAHHARMLTLAATGETACHRDNYLPGHFTASAFVVSPDESQVLLILHSKLQLWLQPGGHIDPSDDSLEAAARRELLEETGLRDVTLTQEAPLDLDIHVIPARLTVPAHEHFDVRFLFTAHDMTHTASSDALDAKWVPLAELTRASTDESVRRAARKITNRY